MNWASNLRAEIIGVFLTDLTERVHAIGLQMSRDDRAGIAATAHAIKGSSGHFGALHLMELSHERTPGQARADRRSSDDDRFLVVEAQRVRTALEAYRSNYMRGPVG